MKSNKTNKKSGDEVEVGDLFRSIGKGFSNIISFIVETAKQHNFVYGLVSGKTPDTQEMAKGEDNYEVTTVHSFVDGLISALTGGLYNPTTVEVKR